MTHVQYLHGDAGYRESGDSTILVVFFFFGYCKNTLKLKVKKKNWCCCVGSDHILQKSLF